METLNALDAFEELFGNLAGSKDNGQDGFLTVQELAILLRYRKTGRNVKWIREKLQLIAAAGRLVVGRKRQMDLTGRQITVPAYKVSVPKVKRAKKK